MNKLLLVGYTMLLVFSCKLMPKKEPAKAGASINTIFEDYYQERMKRFPLEATANGDNRYNNLLQIDFTDNFRDSLKTFYTTYLEKIKRIDRNTLNENDRISYDIFKREMEISIENFQFPDNYMPLNQFWSLPLSMGQLGSGEGNQPFKTITDYENWISRVNRFSAWTDSAIVYFRKGMAAGVVLPKVLVEKTIPQLKAMETTEPAKSLFYGPINKLPTDFTAGDKNRLTTTYNQAISEKLVPAYSKLARFLEQEYLPRSRSTTGISALPGGKQRYQYMIRYWTTTNKTPEEIFNIGEAEVKRIQGEMEKIRLQSGFHGDLKSFFEFMKTDKQFMPYRSPEEVLTAFRLIQQRIDPNLKRMFGRVPKTAFEIRQTEAFRAASASAEYNPGSPDGSRPGIFYVPILNANTYNTTSGMESLFLHEAIPGHHYQVSLQQENESLPKFRRFSWYGAYGEGWALYCESLGKELGLYTDPYQYLGALGDELHRAIRLVVDVGMHEKGWTREQAIKYMMDNEAISEQGTVAEIERYMALPGQALSYKIGALKIRELRNRYENEMGKSFSLGAFHDEFLKDGCMPLDIVEAKMNVWAKNYQRTP